MRSSLKLSVMQKGVQKDKIPTVAPTGPYPADDATIVEVNVVLTWTAVLYAASYEVHVWDASGDEEDGTSDTVTTNSLDYGDEHGDLDDNTEYNWRVIAIKGDIEQEGEVWSFTTGSSLNKNLWAAWTMDAATAAGSSDSAYPSGASKKTLTRSGTWTASTTGGKEGGFLSSVGAAARSLYISDTFPAQFTIGAFFQKPGLTTPSVTSTTTFGMYTSGTIYQWYIYTWATTDGKYGIGVG